MEEKNERHGNSLLLVLASRAELPRRSLNQKRRRRNGQRPKEAGRTLM